MKTIQDLTREELLEYVKVLAANWLAHDGCWFLAAEQRYGMKLAKELNDAAWEQFTRVEAARVMKFLGLPEGGGLDALDQALRFRLYANLNVQRIERVDERTLRFTMVDCRVQSARQRKALAPYPCKSAGIVEYTGFAQAIDPRLKTRCVFCPPDGLPADGHCCWEFTLADEPVDRTK